MKNKIDNFCTANRMKKKKKSKISFFHFQSKNSWEETTC